MPQIASILEMGMLICFGVSWPVNLYKSYTYRKTAGKSLLFLVLIFVGYLFGLGFKAIRGFDYVSWFYVVNALMVLGDICLYFRNRRLERLELSAPEGAENPDSPAK